MKEVKDIWQFFENMNEYVYATDIETHEIVYMNRKTLQVYGLQSLEDAKGKKCYELLQKTLIPCGMCNNDRLSVGEFEEWHYYNPIIDRYLMLKDTLIEDSANGKKYRVELGVDISEKRTQDGVIQKYQNMEFMINEGLRIALQTATPEQSIEVILEYLGNSLNGERTYIFERNERGRDDSGLRKAFRGKKKICRIFLRKSVRTGIGCFRRESLLSLRILRKSGKAILYNMRI